MLHPCVMRTAKAGTCAHRRLSGHAHISRSTGAAARWIRSTASSTSRSPWPSACVATTSLAVVVARGAPAHNHWYRHAGGNLNPPLAAILGSNICEQLYEKMVVLLSCTSFPIVGRGVLELNSFEGSFGLWCIWILTEAAVVKAT
jgi:hypothetical protein